MVMLQFIILLTFHYDAFIKSNIIWNVGIVSLVLGAINISHLFVRNSGGERGHENIIFCLFLVTRFRIVWLYSLERP